MFFRNIDVKAILFTKKVEILLSFTLMVSPLPASRLWIFPIYLLVTQASYLKFVFDWSCALICVYEFCWFISHWHLKIWYFYLAHTCKLTAKPWSSYIFSGVISFLDLVAVSSLWFKKMLLGLAFWIVSLFHLLLVFLFQLLAYKFLDTYS